MHICKTFHIYNALNYKCVSPALLPTAPMHDLFIYDTTTPTFAPASVPQHARMFAFIIVNSYVLSLLYYYINLLL